MTTQKSNMGKIMKNLSGYAVSFAFLTLFLLGSQTPVRANAQSALSVTCSPSSTSTLTGSQIIWTANVSGGNTPYQYQWSGSDNLSGTSHSSSITYTTPGSKTATVHVTSSDNQSITVNCGSAVMISELPVTGHCSVNVNPNIGGAYFIAWNSSMTNVLQGTSTSYAWTGTDGLSDNLPITSKSYSTQGLKIGNIAITSGSQTLSLACSAYVQNEPPQSDTNHYVPSLSGSCSPTVSGMTVSWTSSASAGGVGSTTYTWSGSDGLTATSTQNPYMTYTTEGIKTATVYIQNQNQSLALTCQAKIASTTAQNTIPSGHCFIATAAYGTYMQPEVMVLRHFRDETLLKTKLGQAFVAGYYKVSPPIADFIQPHPTLRAIVRFGLSPIIYGLKQMGYTS